MTGADAITRALTPPGAAADSLAGAPNREQVEALAREFESTLLLQVMRQVRQTMTSWGDSPDSGDENVLGGNLDALNDTIDGELARFLSQSGGFGLSAYLARSLADSPVISGRAAAPAPTTAPVAAAPVAPQASSAQPPPPVANAVANAAAAAPMAKTDTPAAATVPGIPPGAVTSAFGWRQDPLQHTARFHAGVDIRAAYGQPVPAAAAGRVVLAREQGNYGLTVVVAHADGYQTRYAHLSSLNVGEGDTVSEQQTVGLAGRSGRATGPHVHFEITRDGRLLDPAAVVQSRAFKKTVARADLRDGGWSPSGTAPTE